ncbi:MAG: signal peptidase I [Lachnospiraceae bacterium]
MKKAYNIVTSVLLILLITLVILLFLPKLLGYTPMAVLSGSMEPTYHVGSLIYVNKTSPGKVQVGDPITFYVSKDIVVTHRVTSVDREEQSFHTKGDANNTEDGGMVTYDRLIGKPAFSIPLLGYLAVYTGTRTGIIILMTLIVVVIILTFLPDWLMKEKESEGEKHHERTQ